MVLITKDEKEAISARYPDAHIVRTMKQKSKRHRYYVEESRPVMRLLNQLRATKNGQKDGAADGNNEKKRRV